MCIRDSARAGAPADEDVQAATDAGLEQVGRRTREGPHGDQVLRREAVSYTHLRAHETVLDLVCRLLLEKKKKQTNNSNICISLRNGEKLHNQP